MDCYSLKNILDCTDRYKLFVYLTSPDQIQVVITWFHYQNIHPINLGKELASFINELDDQRYLHIDTQEYTKNLLEKQKSTNLDFITEVIAVYNLGILLEPELGLNAEKLLKDISKSSPLIIIWENQSQLSNQLHWPTQQNNIFLDFTETPLKTLHYAIQRTDTI